MVCMLSCSTSGLQMEARCTDFAYSDGEFVGHALDDTFVAKAHSEKLLAKYGGEDKRLVTFEGDHNSIRPIKFYGDVLRFFHSCLQCTHPLIPDEQNSGQFELVLEDTPRSVCMCTSASFRAHAHV